MNDLTARQINQLNNINNQTEAMDFGEIVQDLIDGVNVGVVGDKGETGDKGATGDPGPVEVTMGTPVNAESASLLLTFTGPVLDGEIIIINNPEAEGIDVYEFAADEAQTVSEGAIPVDIEANTVKATNDLTVDTNPSLGDTMTIGEKVFTFVPLASANGDGDIGVGIDLAATQANIVKAIKGTDGVNTPHPLVDCGAAFAVDVLAITALIGGSAGNSIGTTETFTAETNIFSAANLETGADCIAADAIVALLAAVAASDTQGVGAAAGEGTTVLFSADGAGAITNTIVVGEDLSNASFAEDGELLVGGSDGTVGIEGQVALDDTYLYVCIADNDETGRNWRRITLGAAY